MKQLTLVLFFLLSFSTLFAQKGTISGKIINQQTQEPIAESHVFIPNTTFQTYSDSLGNFSISGIPVGPWELFAAKSGFENSSKNLQVSQSRNILEGWVISESESMNWEGLKDSKTKKAKEQFEARIGIDPKGSELVLINPEALVFFEKEDANEVWVDLSDVLLVQNLNTGYLISMRLRRPLDLSEPFEDGDLLLSFLEMDLGSVEEKNLINSNRVEAYQNSPVFAIRKLIGDRPDQIKVNATDQEGAFILHAKSPIEIKKADQGYRAMAFDGEGIEIRTNGSPVYPELLKTQGFIGSGHPFKTLPLDFDYDQAIALDEVDRSLEAMQERVFLHTDKDVYLMGEELYFKAYLMLGNPLLVEEASKVLHIEIVDPTGYSMLHKVYPLENGLSSGAIFLGPELNTKDFIVKAYTLWGSNYGADFEYYKPIQVMSSLWEIGQSQIEPKSEGIVVFSDKQVYQSQDSITLNVIVNNQKGSIAAANLSLAVVQGNGIQKMNASDDLLIDFLKFKPEFGHIDSSGFDFQKEYGLTLKGKINDSLPQINKAKVEVMIDGFMDRRELNPDFAGEFLVEGLHKEGEFPVLVKATSPDGRIPLRNIDLELLSPGNQFDFSRYDFGKVHPLSKRPLGVDSLISEYLKVREGEILLDEVEVEDVKEENFGAMPYGRAERTYEMDGVYLSGDTQQFIYSFANRTGFRVSGIPPMIINARGAVGGPPLILLNGAPITPVTGPTLGSDGGQAQYRALQSINVFNIKKIEVIKSVVPAYGDAGKFGVINIITKTGTEMAADINTYQEFKLVGLEKLRKGAKTEFESDNPTIYWNPNLGISSSQTSATIKFKLPENPGPFWVIVNGVNSSGEPVSGRFLMNQKSLGGN
jgi:hypothetical protein